MDQLDYAFVAIGNTVARMKVDYGAVYHGTPDGKKIEEHKRQYGTEPNFFD
ncbi:MAG: hypothetical protein LUG99_16280 [Lachnospiraceae bacterium]|nr:hypothetical protein [Lachnospiraceae bacterium]